MSFTLENYVKSLLAGQSLENDMENEIIGSMGIGAIHSSDIPICQKTVTYIAAAVVLNEKDELLMVQEAKPSCKGKWYLPAGRVEPNESLLDAVKREVLEETGLIFEPSTLIQVEFASASWFRFVFTGSIIGGSLKTLDRANAESLQARWVHDPKNLRLRSNDIISLIETGRNYMLNKTTPHHPYLLPGVRPLNKLLLRLIIVSKKKETNKLHILVPDSTATCLPICEVNRNRTLHTNLFLFMVDTFGPGVAQHKPHGILSVEFSGGQGGDGFCLTLLVSFGLPLDCVPPVGKYMWHEVTESIATALISRLPRNMTVPLDASNVFVTLAINYIVTGDGTTDEILLDEASNALFCRQKDGFAGPVIPFVSVADVTGQPTLNRNFDLFNKNIA